MILQKAQRFTLLNSLLFREISEQLCSPQPWKLTSNFTDENPKLKRHQGQRSFETPAHKDFVLLCYDPNCFHFLCGEIGHPLQDKYSRALHLKMQFRKTAVLTQHHTVTTNSTTFAHVTTVSQFIRCFTDPIKPVNMPENSLLCSLAKEISPATELRSTCTQNGTSHPEVEKPTSFPWY